MNNLCAGILAGLDKEVDDVEDVEGRPREEEHNAHPNQNPGRTNVLIELKLIINLLPIFEFVFDDNKSSKWRGILALSCISLADYRNKTFILEIFLHIYLTT